MFWMVDPHRPQILTGDERSGHAALIQRFYKRA
jgi:hypothetical protein